MVQLDSQKCKLSARSVFEVMMTHHILKVKLFMMITFLPTVFPNMNPIIVEW